MYAVIKTGGKQYRVQPGDIIRVEKFGAETGEVVTFDQVLMLGEEGDATVGAPLVDGAAVTAEVLDVRKDDKVLIFKKRRRQNYRRKKGHRQWICVVSVSEILKPGEKSQLSGKAKAAPKTTEAAPAAAGDDLTRLTGVGPALAGKLVEAGVTAFAQIAAWDDAEIERLDGVITGLKAKAEKGDWVAEAKSFAGE